MGKLIGDVDQNSGYGFSSTYLGNKALIRLTFDIIHPDYLRLSIDALALKHPVIERI
ncbi:MAG: hypothetical protein ACRC6P_12930 [Shewanella oncorhynchi]